MLPVHSKLGAAPTGNDIGTATSVLSTFQQDSATVFDAEHFLPSTNSNTNNFQHQALNIDHTALIHTHPISTGGYSGGIWHQNSLLPTEAAQCIGGHVDVPHRESHEISTASANVLRDLTGCHPGAGQDVPFDSYTADFRWSRVFGTTWDSNLGQGEPFNEGVVGQRWMGGFGPIDSSDLNQDLLSRNQTADQQWSGVFGNGWHPCLEVPTNERSAHLDYPVALQPFDHAMRQI